LKEKNIDPATGYVRQEAGSSSATASQSQSCLPGQAALRRRPGSTGINAAAQAGQEVREGAQSWLGRNKWKVAVGAVFAYVILARLLGTGQSQD